MKPLRRSSFLITSGSVLLSGCSGLATSLTNNEKFRKVLDAPEKVNLAILGHGQPLAREYGDRDVPADFRQNGFDAPATADYERWSRDGWRGYRLFVTGLVEQPRSYDLAALQNRFKRYSQITRHDCVEGWSVIGKWTGAKLGDVLSDCKPRPQARYVVFRCMDDDGAGNLYYESLDMRQAVHPQALLAYGLNDRPIPVKNGAPVRLKVPTQLGYKSAKYIQHIEIVAGLGGQYGKGGYWEDQNYDWFAGI
ncbi:MAG: molybdopterin-dependent oxidoreductase [Candidatus Eremiobacteraeota bacterium]|nr:molybdopterin-dependent oxidoreductase [Candidatus Eremiobacteraeota bacterium]